MIHDLTPAKKVCGGWDGKLGPVTRRFYDTLNAIRNGEAEDARVEILCSISDRRS